MGFKATAILLATTLMGLVQCSSYYKCPDGANDLGSCELLNRNLKQCTEGHYWKDFCLVLRTCPPGKGVAAHKSIFNNTVCVKCPEGTFSSVDSYTKCQPKSKCPTHSIQVDVRGDLKNDVFCSESFNGTTEAREEEVYRFVSTRVMGPGNFRRIVSLLRSANGETAKTWILEAPTLREQLKQFKSTHPGSFVEQLCKVLHSDPSDRFKFLRGEIMKKFMH
nr:membrane protein [Salmonid herpesvirus 1]